jgi:two-component system, NarL family, invasion response regulator UvrY
VNRILIVDDHAIVRRGLVEFLARHFPKASFGEAADAEEAARIARKQPWDLILLDIGLPGKSGLELLKDLRAIRPTSPILVLSAATEEQYGIRALKAGASGFVAKESAPEELVQAILKVMAGRRYLSPSLVDQVAVRVGQPGEEQPHERLSDREFEVMRLIASGKRLKQIAELLGVSPKTVTSYRARVLEKMGMESNAELTQYAITNKLIS